MLLVFNRTRSNGMIGNQIFNIRKTCWIKQLIRSCQTSFCNHTVVEMSDRFQTIHKAWCCLCIWLVHQAFIAIPVGPRFSRIDPHHNENLIFDLLLQVCQTTGIVHHSFFIIRRARPDHKKDPLVFSFDNSFQFSITRFFALQGWTFQAVKRSDLLLINLIALRNEYHTASLC